MSITVDKSELMVQLDHRRNDGLDVWLEWDRTTDTTFVRILDAKNGFSDMMKVEAKDAKKVFDHPYGTLFG